MVCFGLLYALTCFVLHEKDHPGGCTARAGELRTGEPEPKPTLEVAGATKHLMDDGLAVAMELAKTFLAATL